MATSKMKYFKLGGKATAFFCPKCQLKVVNKLPGKVIYAAFKTSAKGKVAKANGHIVEIDEEEFTKLIAVAKGLKETPDEKSKDATDETSDVTAADIKKMNKDQLYTYYKDNYEASADDLDEFKGKTKPEAIAYLIELEEEEEE